jgi:hypothetical protein
MLRNRWLLLSALSVACASSTHTRVIEHAAETDHILTLPTDWSVGSRYNYRASWNRDAVAGPALPGAKELAQGMRSEVTGEVLVTVLEKSDSGYVLRWEPTLAPTAGPATGADRMAAAGAALWRYQLGLTLELELSLDDSTAPLTLRNQADIHRQVTREFARLARGLDLEVDCEGADDASCGVFGSVEGTRRFVENYVGALFGCAALEVDRRQPLMTWSEPHPDPALGDAVPIDYRREVVAFVPGSHTVRARTVWEPNPRKWGAWVKQEMGKIPGWTEPLARQLDGMRFRFETDCTMDVRTGWPAVIEHRASGGVDALAGVDVKRFERMDK